jgi:hypothetical protein
MMKLSITSLILLCLSSPCITGMSAMKGVWLPIQAVSGYPHWNDFLSSEASATAQALMYATERPASSLFLSISHTILVRLARCGVTDIFVDVWNNGCPARGTTQNIFFCSPERFQVLPTSSHPPLPICLPSALIYWAP